MFPLLLLFLVGGAVVAAAASSSGAASGAASIDNKDKKLTAAKYGQQRFADPLYDCFGAKGRPYWISNPPRGWGLNEALFRSKMNPQQDGVIVGYEYLEKSSDAKSRIEAIRWKINTYRDGKAQSSPGFWLPSKDAPSDSMTLKSVIETSKSQLNSLADAVADRYSALSKDAASVEKFASAYGVSASSVKDEIAAVAVPSDTIKLIDTAVKRYGPIASAVVTAVQQALSSGVLSSNGVGSYSSKVAFALDAIGGIAASIPVYGQVVSMFTSNVSDTFRKKAEAEARECQDQINGIQSMFTQSSKQGYVVPWHWDAIFPADACRSKSSVKAEGGGSTWDTNLSDTQLSAYKLARANWWYQAGNESKVLINPVHRNAIKRWWGLASVYMNHPKVKEVFRALGRDARGGVVASDEQVMLVSCVYAVANGFDVDEFAKELWETSIGWRAVDPTFWALPEKNIKREDGGGTTYCFGSAVPVNAWWLQWAVLIMDAEFIVDMWRTNPAEAKKAKD